MKLGMNSVLGFAETWPKQTSCNHFQVFFFAHLFPTTTDGIPLLQRLPLHAAGHRHALPGPHVPTEPNHSMQTLMVPLVLLLFIPVGASRPVFCPRCCFLFSAHQGATADLLGRGPAATPSGTRTATGTPTGTRSRSATHTATLTATQPRPNGPS